MTVYKIFREKEYELFISNGYTLGSQTDIKDGFIHLSTRYQLWETVNKHFSDLKNFYISAFYFSCLDHNLKWEISRNNDYFPHYYGKLLSNNYLYSLEIRN